MAACRCREQYCHSPSLHSVLLSVVAASLQQRRNVATTPTVASQQRELKQCRSAAATPAATMPQRREL